MTTKIKVTMQKAWIEFIQEYGRSCLQSYIDSWDECPEMLDEKPYYRSSYESMKKKVIDLSECFECGVDMAAGVVYGNPDESNFSSWEVEGGIFIVKIPFDRVLTPDEIFPDAAKDWRYIVEWLAIGQYHDDSSHTWASRLWDRVEEEEVPDSRFISDDLGMAVTMSGTTILYKLVEKGKLLDQPIKR